MTIEEQENQAAKDFIAAHPEYQPTVTNGKLFMQYLGKSPVTLATLEHIYREHRDEFFISRTTQPQQ